MFVDVFLLYVSSLPSEAASDGSSSKSSELPSFSSDEMVPAPYFEPFNMAAELEFL